MKTTMKTLAIAGLCAMSAGAFASGSSVPVKWFGTVPGVLPGSDIIITGLNKGDVQDGILIVENDGTFVSQDTVALESHSYTPEDATAGTSAIVGDLVNAEWSLKTVAVVPGSYDAKNIKVSFNNEEVAAGSNFSMTEDTVYLSVKNENPNTSVVPGDHVRVTTTVMANVAA
ncbi:TPA: hypothetical protein ACX6RU_000614 [Photobacterium damselae]